MPNTTLNYKNFRSNPVNSRNGRPTSGHCVECGRLTNESMGGKRVTIPSQKNGVWVCNAHRGKKTLMTTVMRMILEQVRVTQTVLQSLWNLNLWVFPQVQERTL